MCQENIPHHLEPLIQGRMDICFSCCLPQILTLKSKCCSWNWLIRPGQCFSNTDSTDTHGNISIVKRLDMHNCAVKGSPLLTSTIRFLLKMLNCAPNSYTLCCGTCCLYACYWKEKNLSWEKHGGTTAQPLLKMLSFFSMNTTLGPVSYCLSWSAYLF